MSRFACFFLLFALCLAAGDITGKWAGSFDVTTDGGTKPDRAHMELKQEGDKISGTAGPNVETQWKIENGKLAGDKLTFHLLVSGGPGVIKFTLTVAEDRIHGDAHGQDGERKMQAKVDVKRIP